MLFGRSERLLGERGSYKGVGSRGPAVAPKSVRDAVSRGAFADGLGFGEGWKVVNGMGSCIQMKFMVGSALGEGESWRACTRKDV